MRQGSLFDQGSGNGTEQRLDLPDADIRLIEHWLPLHDANHYFQILRQQLAWEQSVIQIYGKPTPIPRLNAWYGDPHCDYSYSGYQLPLHPWTEDLLALRAQLHQLLGISFNSVLANCYRNGHDSVAWHADNEPELGPRPVIASISLGASRRFVLKHRRRKDIDPVTITLNHGALLVMAGETQHQWLHALPKTRQAVGERINLTFRLICR
ncbi:alpha-ketoglutarate-dependent dioxygenase AlkB [Pseudomaricurvus alkylphenolicus]|uniref:alpha-ketoglutarate-dependent dioxygenase AlkB family protein n=1 Tax=Pseudomaricurvus alkylphenolicus TaxID=1306991 RepID=UPI001424975B|nr:alpha-ketoglutarate-dependent dioxygenase AlkB [Pseudomaricurvus alkylphenolicus]NIB41244.1 alpha-ketoglutarate-dependent dioxygenase AlkB [Pseudomaricurvus alkylphenolicus]